MIKHCVHFFLLVYFTLTFCQVPLEYSEVIQSVRYALRIYLLQLNMKLEFIGIHDAHESMDFNSDRMTHRHDNEQLMCRNSHLHLCKEQTAGVSLPVDTHRTDRQEEAVNLIRSSGVFVSLLPGQPSLQVLIPVQLFPLRMCVPTAGGVGRTVRSGNNGPSYNRSAMMSTESHCLCSNRGARSRALRSVLPFLSMWENEWWQAISFPLPNAPRRRFPKGSHTHTLQAIITNGLTLDLLRASSLTNRLISDHPRGVRLSTPEPERSPDVT